MGGQELLQLRKQFQDAYISLFGYLWGSIRVVMTVVLALFSAHTGLTFILFQINSNGYFLPLIIIPIGVLIICIIGWLNAVKDYNAVIEYITCLAKVDDEIDFSRKAKKDRKFFIDDDSILCDRWIKDRKRYNKSSCFIEESLKLLNFRAIGIIKLMLIIVVVIDFCFFLIVNTTFISLVINFSLS